MTGERATILELPDQNPEHRVVAELLALVGARVIGEHRHPALVECFTVLEGDLTRSAADRRALFAEGRPPLSSRMYGTTGGMRATATPVSAWR